MNNANNRIQSYLVTLGITSEQVSEDVWLVNDPDKGLNQIIIFVDESLVTIRCRLMELPPGDRQELSELFETLLRFNLDLVHGAYALEDHYVVIMDTLELNTMDLEEFQASMDAIGLAIAQHYPVLSKYRHS
ncbi:type III secretion system chaperone family protein [Spirochaeta lutea]|uniref:Molecular chaperone Tir n=1 Tax=Spirochaeta lutea TaxID=1480694 RepID=A0A098QVJ8_9SPIO|nr:hypothetical protein [Spirochaeta lutea]KGE71830.1 hypothetical protein DC28_08320 [Spirochaeta lutea]